MRPGSLLFNIIPIDRMAVYCYSTTKCSRRGPQLSHLVEVEKGNGTRPAAIWHLAVAGVTGHPHMGTACVFQQQQRMLKKMMGVDDLEIC